MNNFHLTTIFETGQSDNHLDEILFLTKEINEDVDLELIKKVHGHIIRIFIGDDPAFKASNTEYHNLRHTCSVVLATIRIFHGLTINNHIFSASAIEKGLISAYFHDTGLLLKAHDSTELGARYTKNHEKRSIRFLRSFLNEINIEKEFGNSCASIINTTNLDQKLDEILFESEEVELASWVVSSADILGQMADRYYLEQLPMLFRERRIGGVNNHESVAELMEQTADFYNKDIVHRLETSFKNVAQVMQIHFRARWGIDRDLYKENIDKNISYLSQIIDNCQTELQCIQSYLRRSQPPLSHLSDFQQNKKKSTIH